MLGKHTSSTITHDDVLAMARNMDLNKDGQIDFNEFLETFRLVDQFGHKLDELTRRSSYDDSDDVVSSPSTASTTASRRGSEVIGPPTALALRIDSTGSLASSLDTGTKQRHHALSNHVAPLDRSQKNEKK